VTTGRTGQRNTRVIEDGPSSLRSHHVVRKYRLTVQREGADGFGITLEETFTGGDRMLTAPVVVASRAQTARVLDAVVHAVKASGHASSVLAFEDSVIALEEAPGVRLGLTFFAAMPLMKSARIRAIVAGINAMSIEEAYYWYSKCVGQDGARARKALRTLLADA